MGKKKGKINIWISGHTQREARNLLILFATCKVLCREKQRKKDKKEEKINTKKCENKNWKFKDQQQIEKQ